MLYDLKDCCKVYRFFFNLNLIQRVMLKLIVNESLISPHFSFWKINLLVLCHFTMGLQFCLYRIVMDVVHFSLLFCGFRLPPRHRFAKTRGSEGQAGENELKLYSLNTMRPDYAQAQLCKNKHVHFCSTSIKNYSSDSIAIF